MIPATTPTVDAIYESHLLRKTAISDHLARIRALASGLDLAVEFGVKQGASSSALLMGAERVISYDIVRTPQADALAAAAGYRWEYRIQSSLDAEPIPCDLLFLDSFHSYLQVSSELNRHASHVSKFIIAHDTITFGSIGALDETGRQSWTYQTGIPVPFEHMGIRPAFDELMIHDPSWRILAHYTYSHGLLVLGRM